MSSFYRSTPTSIICNVKAIANAKHSKVDAVVTEGERSYLSIKVQSPAAQGKANTDIIKILAKSLTLPPSACSLISGYTSRYKQIECVGDVSAMLQSLSKYD